MSKQREPFNISLIDNSKTRLAGLLPVQSMDIRDTEGNFHPQGLYSTEVFGKPGEHARMNRHGYIDMRTEVLHPKIFLELSRLKNLYSGILSGTAYAVWDEQLKDFVKSDILDGKTGYSFFMNHFLDIKFEKNDSSMREQRILLIEKFRTASLYRYLIVLPAGLREIEVGADGRDTEDEINGLYRRVMRVANTIAVRSSNSNDTSLDNSRWLLQSTFNEIYSYIETILEGKRGFILSKWATRVLHGGTRNVITAMDAAPVKLGAENAVTVNDTIVGLHQYLKGTVDLSIYGIRTGYWGTVVTELPGNITVLDMRTKMPTTIKPSSRTKEKWGTIDGMEELFNGFSEASVRHKPALIENHFVGLIYMDDQYFKVVYDINEVPEGWDRNKVRPISWAELYYFSVYWQSKEVIAFVTRYPITGPGSTYPSRVFLRVTNNGLSRTELNDDWQPSEKVWHEIPNPAEPFFDSMSVHPSKTEGTMRLNADYDGDKTSCNIVYSDEAKAEGKKFLESKEAFIDVNGKLKYGLDGNHIASLVLHNFTSGLE